MKPDFSTSSQLPNLLVSPAGRGAMVNGMLLEREAELGILGGLIASLDSTGGKIVLIRGEAGIGKSALVERFVDSNEAEAYVHYGSCDDLFIPQPLAPFWDMARTDPSLRGPLEDGDRRRLLDVVMGFLSRPERPTIMVVEDTHWADEATLDAIRYLGRRVARTNAVLVLTYRDGEVDYEHPLRGVIGDIPVGSVVRIQLAGLSLTSVSSIVARSGLDPADVLSATGGNPLLVTEMSTADDETIPSSLQDSLMARVQKLSIGSQEMLKTLAVIPEPIPITDASGLAGVEAPRLDECEQRGLLDLGSSLVAFRHDLIRRAVESAMTQSERVARNRAVLDGLPEETNPSLLVHCAVEANDIERLLDLAPRSARYAVIAGSHRQAVEDFRELGPYLERIAKWDLGPLLDEWAQQEFMIDNGSEAMRVGELARDHHRKTGDMSAESHALATLAQYYENAGRHDQAVQLASEAIEVLGEHPAASDLANALDVNAYLQMMSGNATRVLELVDRTLQVGGPDIDERILVRSLNHKGVMLNVAEYPSGLASVDEARVRAESSEQWYEECRALINNAWACAEWRDIQPALDYAKQAIALAERHELRTAEVYAKALLSRILELSGDWSEAMDLAHGLLDAGVTSQMVALPVLGAIETRRGRASAREVSERAWDLASAADEFQRLAPAAITCAEYAWISGNLIITVADLERVMAAGLDLGFRWSTGRIACWLWELGELSGVPAGIAEPYQALIEGDAVAASKVFESRGIPYERALALMHGSQADQLEALELLEALGARAVAVKFRKELRGRGVSVPRGRGHATRRNAAGLTARQAEVLQLLAEDLSNIEIADRLFVSPRTVEHHVSAVLDKLDVSTREEAVSSARAGGLLEPPPGLASE